MNALISGLDALLGVLKIGFFGAAAVMTVVCGIDWAVRTRRISPFSGVARFFRGSVDPLLAPVERRVLRAGGVPTSAPWWALAAVVLGGIVVLSLLDFLRGQIFMLSVATGSGAAGLIPVLIHWIFSILQIALLVRVVTSWIRVSPYSRWVRWAFVLTEPILRPIRAIVPNFGMIDLSPLVAYFALYLLERLILGML